MNGSSYESTISGSGFGRRGSQISAFVAAYPIRDFLGRSLVRYNRADATFSSDTYRDARLDRHYLCGGRILLVCEEPDRGESAGVSERGRSLEPVRALRYEGIRFDREELLADPDRCRHGQLFLQSVAKALSLYGSTERFRRLRPMTARAPPRCSRGFQHRDYLRCQKPACGRHPPGSALQPSAGRARRALVADSAGGARPGGREREPEPGPL